MLKTIKSHAEYYLLTATGLLATGMLIGAVKMLFTGEDLMFAVFLAAYLLRESRIESPAIVVIDKEAFEKQQKETQ